MVNSAFCICWCFQYASPSFEYETYNASPIRRNRGIMFRLIVKGDNAINKETDVLLSVA